MNHLLFKSNSSVSIMLRMLIADDHPIVRQRLKQLLSEGFPSASLEEADDTASLLDGALNKEWDIVISDLAMPGGGGLHALEKIKQTKPDLPVLIVSTYPADQYASRVISAGAAAFLNKDNADTELTGMVRQILQQKSK
jgi:two-component system invasion response regulator UvrY